MLRTQPIYAIYRYPIISTRWVWHIVGLACLLSLLGLVYVKFSIRHGMMQRSTLAKTRKIELARYDALLSERAHYLSPAVLKQNAREHAGMRLPPKGSIVTISVNTLN